MTPDDKDFIPNLSPAERERAQVLGDSTRPRMAGMNDERERALDQLVREALAYRSGPELKALFEFQRKFPHMAAFNVMLLHIQNPGIQYALRAQDWRDRYARKVKPAARPYVVLRTMGPVDFVFDLSDTEPIDPQFDRVPDLATNPFAAKGEASTKMLHDLVTCCGKAAIQVEQRDLATSMAGAVRRVEDRMRDFHIVLNSKHNVATRFGTLTHELAHVLCGHLGPGPLKLWPDRACLGLTIAVKEFEAEMVAHLFTIRRGVDIGSADYLADYFEGDKSVPVFSLETVLKADHKLEEMAAGRIRIPKRP